jgi:hypothetical protein
MDKVELSSHPNATGTYSLSFNCQKPCVCSSTNSIAFGETKSGELSTIVETDCFTFDAQRGEKVSIKAIGTGGDGCSPEDGCWKLAGPDGSLLTGQVCRDPREVQLIDGGPYTIRVFDRAQNDPCVYDVSLTKLDCADGCVPPPSSCEPTFIGPVLYHNTAPSPFSCTTGFSYFHLEDFEDHELNTPGVSVDTTDVTVSVCSQSPGASQSCDAVDSDDGAIDSDDSLSRFNFCFSHLLIREFVSEKMKTNYLKTAISAHFSLLGN